MGACTSKKVANQVDMNAIVSKHEINHSAHQHLKDMLSNEDPMNASMSSEALNSTLKKMQRPSKEGEEAKVFDKDASAFQQDGGRLHEPLWQAIESNDLTNATRFLNLNEIEEQNMYDAQGQSMLHKCAQLGHSDMLMLLLERTGAKPDLVNAQLATPLHIACRSNKEPVVKFLIGCGVEANVQDEHGQTPLLVSCIHGYTPLVVLLVESSIAGHLPEPLEVDTSDHRGLTPLNCAAIKGDLELVKTLLSRGQADVNQTSPKGCTPLIYAGRGGYSEVVRLLLEKRASPLKQDNAGGTVLHHAIEKGHINVLEVMLEHGVDVYSAIEIADNAGRTPLFEAVEMEEEQANQFGVQPSQGNDEAEKDNKIENLIKILCKPKRRQDGGFGAKINVLNYNGQSPLFSAVKGGNFAAIKSLVEMGASVDLNNGELVKEEEQAEATDEDYESVSEKCFMEAFMNCITPLHVAATLGYDEIALFLIANGAEVNLQSNYKRYTALHMAVLSNKPEMLIELLTKSTADPLMEDSQGRTLLDLIYAYNPSYVESFQALLENLQVHRMKKAGEEETAAKATVATHFVNAEDERAIQGAADGEIEGMYEREETKRPDGGLVRDPSNQLLKKGFDQFEEEDIQIDDEGILHGRVEACFGRKLALGLIAADWKIKEMAIKIMTKRLEKLLAKADTTTTLVEVVEACSAAVGQTCREKVIKVFNVSLHMLNLMISSSKIDGDAASIAMFLQMITEEEVVPKLLLKSEESNTRLTNKIHETLLDLSYHPKIGEDLVALSILQRIEQHHNNRATNHKGLLAQLALLFKFINSFGIEVPNKNGIASDGGQALTVSSVMQAAVPAIGHTNQDVKNAAIKIVLDVQRLTGLVKDHHLSQLPDKTREMIKEKVFSVKCEAELNQTSQRKQNVMTQASKGGEALAAMLAAGSSINVVNIGEAGFNENVEVDLTVAQESFDRNKAIVMEKGQHKDWQQRELALNAMHECFETTPNKIIKESPEFLQTCTIILKNCLEENNIQIYLVGVQTASVFLQKSLNNESVVEALPTLLRAIILRTTDTNTRVRKKSIDLVNQIWDSNGPSNAVQVIKSGQKNRDHDQISIMIAQVLCDSQLHDKAIVGRISLFIKKSMMIESGEELSKRAFKMVIGKDYEEMTEFACQWCMHKNTKVRQCALKLIVEVCRLNYIDPRGQPFKQRIINFILGLRPSLRDPLVAKINEVCAQEQVGQVQGLEEPKTSGEPFINVSEMELNIATKGRAASMDVRRGMRREPNSSQANLPQIPGGQNAGAPALPGLAPGSQAPGQIPTIVLPHSEPLSDALKSQAEPFLEVFGEELMTCFYSQTWSTRAAAIQKIEEQLHNLDPRRRDAMYGEINRSNQPPELTIKIFLQLIAEGFKDPNLKNYLSLLELVQQALPIYFRYLQPVQVKAELVPLVKNTISKTSDLKAKVREASINFCLYLSHQSPIGPEVMINQVIEELNRAFRPQQQDQQAASTAAGTSATSFGSSHMIASCLKLLNEFQQQTKIVETMEVAFFPMYMHCINEALRHTNPTVRKQGEALFKVLFLEFGEVMLQKLINQKPQLVQKLTQESKKEAAAQREQNDGSAAAFEPNATAASFGQTAQDRQLADQQRMLTQLSDNFASMPAIKQLVDNREELLKELRMPNPKKRLKAIVEIKKVIQKKMAIISSAAARDQVEPMQILLRELLKDENTDVYLEALNLLKFIVGSLATHMSALDLHLMMGQFISLTVTNASSANMRIRVASDKVIIFFAKHSNIGSYIVAKEVLKNIERTNRALVSQPPASMSPQDALAEQAQKKEILVRHYNIMHMLLQQFSIVLCYQPDFYVQCLGHIAETLNQPKIDEEPAIKSICTQIIISLHNIDNDLLDSGINKLDFTKKAPIRKFMIEHENLSQKNKNLQVITNPSILSHQGPTHGPNFIADAADRDGSPKQSMRDTQQSFTSFNRSNQGDVPESPAMGRMRHSVRDFGQTDTSQSWNMNRQNSEVRSSRRQTDYGGAGFRQQDSMQMTGQSWADRRAAQLAEQNGTGSSMLPDIGKPRRAQMGESFQSMGNMGRMTGAAGFKRDSVSGSTGYNYAGGAGNTQTSSFGMNQPTDDMSNSRMGGAGGYKPSSPMKSGRRQSFSNRMAGSEVTSSMDKPNRPPKYEPTRREAGDRNSGMRDSMNSGGMPPRGQQSNYQPKTSFSYVPSAAEPQQQTSGLFARQGSRGSSGSRYQPSAAAGSSSGFGQANYQPMGSRGFNPSNDITSPVQSPAMMKPPTMPPAGPPKPKAMAPPVATFQTKTFDYQEPKKNNKGPDMMM